jgi:transcription elongation factor GreA-like protein
MEDIFDTISDNKERVPKKIIDELDVSNRISNRIASALVYKSLKENEQFNNALAIMRKVVFDIVESSEFPRREVIQAISDNISNDI